MITEPHNNLQTQLAYRHFIEERWLTHKGFKYNQL